MTTVDLATFCYAGDAHRLHAPGQLEKQVSSNGYSFNQVIVVYQNCDPDDYEMLRCPYPVNQVVIHNIDDVLRSFGVDLEREQYQSPTDKHHTWKQHIVNHLTAVNVSQSDYIVFADNDCWMVRQPAYGSWVELGIDVLAANSEIFIVSPNDGEPARRTQVMSQQMFMARTDEFRNADFNQPGWDGDVTKHPELPEYHAMAEGRIHHYCKATNKYRYVLPPEYRYWHHNRLNEEGHFETRYDRY